jgi:hypothetical protein
MKPTGLVAVPGICSNRSSQVNPHNIRLVAGVTALLGIDTRNAVEGITAECGMDACCIFLTARDVCSPIFFKPV